MPAATASPATVAVPLATLETTILLPKTKNIIFFIKCALHQIKYGGLYEKRLVVRHGPCLIWV